MEGAAEHLDEEVDGVAALVGVEPAPVVVFDDQSGEVGQVEVAVWARLQAQALAGEQGRQFGAAGGLYLASGPARVRRWGGHGRSGSGAAHMNTRTNALKTSR